MLRFTSRLLSGYAVIIDTSDITKTAFPLENAGVKKIVRPPPGKRLKTVDHNLESEYSPYGPGHGHGHGHGHGDAGSHHGHGASHHGSGHGHGHGDAGSHHGHDHGHHEIYNPKPSKFSFNTRIPVAHKVLEDIPETKFVVSQRTSTNNALTTTKEHNQIAQVNIAELEKADYRKKHPNLLAHKIPYTPFDNADLVTEETQDFLGRYQLDKYKIGGSQNPSGPTYLKTPFSPRK